MNVYFDQVEMRPKEFLNTKYKNICPKAQFYKLSRINYNFGNLIGCIAMGHVDFNPRINKVVILVLSKL